MLTSEELNKILDLFVDLYSNGIKQLDKNWYDLMGLTVGGSEIAAIMGLNPFLSFYNVVENKINICNGIKQPHAENLSCWWGNLFENIIIKHIEIDIGNKVKGNNICIQKYEGHRNSPDGYIVANFFKKDGQFHLWTTDLPNNIKKYPIILLLELKCPITRRITGDIPKYYKPQVLSGLSVSPIAFKGLFVDAVFKKCSIDQLNDSPYYDEIFHKRTLKHLYPISWGSVSIYVYQNKDLTNINKIYESHFNKKIENNTFSEFIDLGKASNKIFTEIMELISNKTLFVSTTTVCFSDGRGDKESVNLQPKTNCFLIAVLPWKLFDLTYVFVDREPNFLESVYPRIQEVHKLVKENLNNPNVLETLRIRDVYKDIYE